MALPPSVQLLRLLAAACHVAAAAAAAVSAPALGLSVDTQTGAFRITLSGRALLAGGVYRVGSRSSRNGTLILTGAKEGNGTDQLGQYRATSLDWSAEPSGPTIMQASFREYDDDAGLLVFEQYFPLELSLRSLGTNESLAGTLFPGFLRAGEGTASDLPCFAYHGLFPSLAACTVATYEASHQGGAPLVIYDPSAAELPMVVLSPLSSPMAHQMAHEGDVFGAGIKSTVDVIPAGWRQLFLLSAGAGVNSGMLDWGNRMLRFNGRTRVDNRYRDQIHGAIGFWTDNGGYYHYSIGDDPSLGRNYEEVLPKVKAYHDSIGVPFKHWQFDSWFYPKDGPVSRGGGGGAVTNWTAMDSVFPQGMAHIQSLLQVPMVMHNRQWSTTSDYIRNWADIEWYMSEIAAVPKDPQKFFERFFQQQQGWGLGMYEQDWMNKEYDNVEALQTNISMGDLWLYGMAAGAASTQRTVQYCMPYPNMILGATALPAVTNARATNDYFAEPNQWAIGNTALFYWALNILPFKDDFYSSYYLQQGGEQLGPELHPDRQALMATLSAAMVGPSDGIHFLNATRVMTTCRKDGTILKPDAPATATDACFRRRDPTCQVYETHSDIAGLGRVHYYFNNNGSAPMLAEEVYLTAADRYAVYNWYTGEIFTLDATNTLTPSWEGHSYAVVTPIVDGRALFGEVRTYVTMAGIRFVGVHSSPDGLAVEVRGVAGETVDVCAAFLKADGTWSGLRCQATSFDEEATQQVNFTDEVAGPDGALHLLWV